MEGLWGISKVNIVNAPLAIVSFSSHLGYNSLQSYIIHRGGGGGGGEAGVGIYGALPHLNFLCGL